MNTAIADSVDSSDTRPRLLVLDDEPEVGDMIRRVGESAGFHTTWAASVKAFDASRRIQAPDLLALDIVLPDADGIELVNSLAREGCQTPLILFSGYPDYLLVAAKLARAKRLNLVAEFTKPWDPAPFIEVLRRVRCGTRLN